jgi:hypothetical protein
MTTSGFGSPSARLMPDTSPFDVLADEFGAVAGRIERECTLRVTAAIADLTRRDAERELLLNKLMQDINERVAARLAEVRDGVDGKDGAPGPDGADGAPGKDGIDGKDGSDGIGIDGKDGANGLPGNDGKDGSDGKDADPNEIAALLVPEVERAVASLPKPENGKDVNPEVVRLMIVEEVAKIDRPKDGQDGKSVTVDDVLPVIEEAIAKIPPPMNGKDGNPGKDGESIVGPPGEIPLSPDSVSEQITKALAFIAQPFEIAQRESPIIVQIQNGERRATSKTITMRRDKDGTAVADVVEHG